MSSILELTNRLLSTTGHGTLNTFLKRHGDLDTDMLQIELFKATGQMYDRRTVATWRKTYGPNDS